MDKEGESKGPGNTRKIMIKKSILRKYYISLNELTYKVGKYEQKVSCHTVN